MFKIKILTTIIALAILHKFSLAEFTSININEISELCGKPFIADDFDPSWETAAGVNENTTMYFPFLSKLYAYRLTQSLFQSTGFESITELQLINSCLTIRTDDDEKATTISGYDGKKFVKSLNSIMPTKVFTIPKNYPDGVSGELSIILSDNKSYNLFNVCYEDGTRSFAVVSIAQTLTDETLNSIKVHLKSLGFNEENFITMNYASCIEQDGVLVSNETIAKVPKPIKKRTLNILHIPQPQSIGTEFIIVPEYYY